MVIGSNFAIITGDHNASVLGNYICETMQKRPEDNQDVIIESDVWIGRDVLMTPGQHISKGSIIAGGCVLCKDFPEYSMVGGNPSKFIKSRK